MYTANTMATAIEALGMSLPYSSSSPADSQEKRDECERAGEAMKLLLQKDIKPRDIMTKAAFENAIHHSLGDENIKIFTPPYFLASKLEAFLQRGKNDGRTSTDFEDIIFLLENRSTIWKELNDAEATLSTYLKETFRKLMQNENFEEWVDCHAGFGRVPATYFIMEQLNIIISKEGK